MRTWRRRLLPVLPTIALVVGIDQLTKHAADSTLNWDDSLPILGGVIQLERMENQGWILSLGHALPEWARRWGIAAGCVLVLATMSWAAIVLRVRGRPLIGVALILAGAGSNVFDHMAHGASIDFIALRSGSFGGVAFNVADLAIALGIALLFSAPGTLPDTEFRWPFMRKRGGEA